MYNCSRLIPNLSQQKINANNMPSVGLAYKLIKLFSVA